MKNMLKRLSLVIGLVITGAQTMYGVTEVIRFHNNSGFDIRVRLGALRDNVPPQGYKDFTVYFSYTFCARVGIKGVQVAYELKPGGGRLEGTKKIYDVNISIVEGNIHVNAGGATLVPTTKSFC